MHLLSELVVYLILHYHGSVHHHYSWQKICQLFLYRIIGHGERSHHLHRSRLEGDDWRRNRAVDGGRIGGGLAVGCRVDGASLDLAIDWNSIQISLLSCGFVVNGIARAGKSDVELCVLHRRRDRRGN